MNVLEKLPGMTDEALGNLHANAERLEQAGSSGTARLGGWPAARDQGRVGRQAGRQAGARRRSPAQGFRGPGHA